MASIPLQLYPYYWSSFFVDLSTNEFISWGTSEERVEIKLSIDAISTIKAVLNHHRELCTKYLGAHLDKQLGLPSEVEKQSFWKLMDAAVEAVQLGLDPERYEVVSVALPEPNPFAICADG